MMTTSLCRRVAMAIALAAPLSPVSAQGTCPCNLVTNPGFETLNGTICPLGFSQISLAKGWFAASGGTPDYFRSCALAASGVGVPNNSFGSEPGHNSSNAYAGFSAIFVNTGGYEYIETKLASPLAPNQKYDVSFYVSLADNSGYAVSWVGAHFSVGPINQSTNTSYLIGIKADVYNTSGTLNQKNGWTLIQGTFNSGAGGQDYITLGRFAYFSPDVIKQSSGVDFAYYYIDDVCVRPICSAAPTFSAQPISLTVPFCQATSLSAAVGGECGVTFQWYCDDCGPTPIPLANNAFFSGVTNSTLQLSAQGVAAYNGHTFHVTATNSCGTSNSQSAVVSIAPVPIVSPATLLICPPQSAILTVSTLGSGAQYQWYRRDRNGVTTPIVGAVSPTLSGSYPAYWQPMPSDCDSEYYCIITKPGCGSVVSTSAKIVCCDCTPPPTNMALWLPFDQVTSPGVTRNVVSGYGGVLWPLSAGPYLYTGWYVDNSLWFDGQTQYVGVMNHGLVDITDGDLTIDAWVFLQETNSDLAVIVDKRLEQGLAARGYLMFLKSAFAGHRLGFTLGTGAQTSWLTPASPLIPHGWHHVAVTVERKSATGGRFYVDGVQVGTFNPTAHQGSLSNTRPFTVGARSTTPSGFFLGAIDEVELFRRALSASEIAALYQANGLGKCKRFVQSYPPTIYCNGSNMTTIGGYLFNFTGTPTTFTGTFGQVASVPTPPNLFFPLLYLPTPVGAWGSQAVWTTATKPAGIGAGVSAFYRVTATAAGKTSSAIGEIVNRPDIYCSNGPATLATPVPLGGSTAVALSFGNAGIPTGSLRYRIEALGPDGMPSHTLSLNGGQPGEPLDGIAPTELGAEFKVLVDASFLEADALGLTTLFLSTDTDGDGTYEFATSISLLCDVPGAPTCCTGDFNCDGQVDDGDFIFFAAAYDDMVCPEAPETCQADLNADGFVDDNDFQVFMLAYDTVVCP